MDEEEAADSVHGKLMQVDRLIVVVSHSNWMSKWMFLWRFAIRL